MTDQPQSSEAVAGWIPLYRIGGISALVAGLVFRRNLAAELSLVGAPEAPDSVRGWFVLLQDNRLLGLTHLNVFDLVNYVLFAVVFLTLYVVLRGTSRSWMAVSTLIALLGIGVYLASSPALSMLSLSDQYAAATSDAQRTALLSSGDAVLAAGRFTSGGALSGSGGYISLLLVAAGVLIASFVMLRSTVFGRFVSLVGIIAAMLDLSFCIAYLAVPTLDRELLAVAFIPAAGLFLVLWHVMTGWKLLRLAAATAPD